MRAFPPLLPDTEHTRLPHDPRLDPHNLGPSGAGCLLGLVLTVLGAVLGAVLWWLLG